MPTELTPEKIAGLQKIASAVHKGFAWNSPEVVEFVNTFSPPKCLLLIAAAEENARLRKLVNDNAASHAEIHDAAIRQRKELQDELAAIRESLRGALGAVECETKCGESLTYAIDLVDTSATTVELVRLLVKRMGETEAVMNAFASESEVTEAKLAEAVRVLELIAQVPKGPEGSILPSYCAPGVARAALRGVTAS